MGRFADDWVLHFKADICRRLVKDNPDKWRQIRELAGITQSQVSSRMGIEQSALSHLESGRCASADTAVLYVTILMNEIKDDKLSNILSKEDISNIRLLTLAPGYQHMERKPPNVSGRTGRPKRRILYSC